MVLQNGVSSTRKESEYNAAPCHKLGKERKAAVCVWMEAMLYG